jgi:hypothetical protein
MRRKLKLSSDGGDSGSKKYKRGHDSAYVGSGVWSRVVGFALLLLTRIWLGCLEDIFTFNLLLKCYTFCTFNAIFKDNSAINYITWSVLFNTKNREAIFILVVVRTRNLNTKKIHNRHHQPVDRNNARVSITAGSMGDMAADASHNLAPGLEMQQ